METTTAAAEVIEVISTQTPELYLCIGFVCAALFFVMIGFYFHR